MAVRAVLSLYYGIAANGTERRNAAGRVCRHRPWRAAPMPLHAPGATPAPTPGYSCGSGAGWARHRPQLRLSMRSMGFTASRATSGSTSTTGHSYFKALYSLSMVFIFM